jgi:hypothetical protein
MPSQIYCPNCQSVIDQEKPFMVTPLLEEGDPYPVKSGYLEAGETNGDVSDYEAELPIYTCSNCDTKFVILI